MAQLNASERKGTVCIVFSKIYDLKILISEKFKNPQPENASWIFNMPTKCLILKPKDQKSLSKAKKVSANHFNDLYFRFEWQSSEKA